MKNGRPICKDFTLMFQLKYCLVMTGCLAVTDFIIFLYFKRGLGDGYSQALNTLSQMEDALPIVILLTFIVQSLLVVLFSIAINLFVSHKIAGPVYRFEHSLRAIEEGDLQHVVRIRNSDQIKMMVEALNRLITALGRNYSALKQIEDELDDVIRQKTVNEKPDLDELRQKVTEFRKTLVGTREGMVQE